MKMRWYVRAAALVVAALLTSPVAHSQAIEEIIVTAQKREESMQDIGVSVTAFSGDTVRDLGLTRSTDIALQTPSLNIGTPVGEGNNPSITLRGVGLNDFNDNNEGPVAVYKDDVYLGTMAGQTFQLFDVERIEVLRGPQGTLYGRNATGGLVHFISRMPTEELDAAFSLTGASNSQVKFEGAISGPLSDRVQARLAVATNDHDGYVENRLGPDTNEARSRAVRGLLNIDLSDQASLLLNAHWGKSDPRAPAYQHQVTDPGGVDVWGYRDPDDDNFAGDYNRTGALDVETSGASATLTWNLGAVELVSITAFEEMDKVHEEDTDVGPVQGIWPDFRADYQQFSQEFRLSGENEALRWVAGLYYYDADIEGDYALRVDYFGGFINFLNDLPEADGGFGGGLALVGAPYDDAALLPFVDYDVDFDQKTESTAVFGQLDYALTDALNLTLGLRYTTEKRDYVYTNRVGPRTGILNDFFMTVGVIDPAAQFVYDYRDGGADVIAGNRNDIDNDNVSGKLGVEWAFADSAMAFANYSRGFKSGGFNAGFMDIDMQTARDVFGVNTQYDEETLDSLEVGIKTELAGGLVRLNATAFSYDYKDFQALTLFGLSQFIVNTDAEVRGGELELVAAPIEGLFVSLGLSALDTEIDAVRNLNTGELLTGTEMVLAPEFSANGLIRYTWDLAASQVSLQADFSHQDDHFFDVVNQSIAREDAYTVWNARASYRFGSALNWEVSAWVQNLTDEEYRLYTFDFSGPGAFNQQFFAPPRWYGVTLDYQL